MQGAYRIRFHVFNLRPGDEWSTVDTEPPMGVRSIRWIGETVELMVPNLPPWQVDEEVMLTLKPYW